MTEDTELLRRYAVEHSEAAFSELIQRHVDLVYSAALRVVSGDVHRAQDITQQVFVKLARQARRLVRHPALVGWLYTTTRLCALYTLRSERRRTAREQEVNAMNELLRESSLEPDWEKLHPVIEDAMHDLGEKDRHAVLLRYFQNKTLKEVGVALDLQENAARMRVDRALDKLRAALTRRGIPTGASLATVISAHAVQVAPAGLATTLTAVSVASTGTTTFTLLKIMTGTKLKLGLAALIVAGGAAAFVLQQQAQGKLRGANAELQQQIAQLQTDNESLSNRLALTGDSKKLSDDQLNELLKLRGEVGMLRNQASDLGRDNTVLKKQLADASKLQTNLTPLQVHIKSRFVAVPKEGFSTPATDGNGLTGILSHQNFTNMLALLEKREDVEMLGEPEITTLSGRQSQMRVTQNVSVITNFALVESDGTNAIVPQAGQIEAGPVIDVSPTVLPDGRTIELPVTASVTDFLGYAQPTNNPVPNYTKDGKEFDVPQVLPQFRVQQSVAKANVWDDQTLVLKLTDKVVPSDAFLQSSTDPKVNDVRKDTLVFITVTIVDSAGNRKNKLIENDSVPVQPDASSN